MLQKASNSACRGGKTYFVNVPAKVLLLYVHAAADLTAAVGTSIMPTAPEAVSNAPSLDSRR